MKNFFKKIAFVLALAMVLTNIGPVAGVNAATAPSLKYASKVLYVGSDALGDYSDTCWTPSQNYAGYKMSYKADKDFIDVTSNGKITANGKGIGAAVVTVTYSKAGAKDITANFTVKVRRNAETVRLANASAALLEEAMNVGDTLELTAAKSINGSYAKGNYGLNNYMGVCSDQLVLVSSDEEVVKVNGMNIEAVGVGEATITVKAIQYAQNKETGVVSKPYDVVVVGGLVGAKLISTNKVELDFASPVSKDEVKAGTITMKNASGVDISNHIKDVSYSEDLKTVTVETFVAFVDKAVYTFEVNGNAVQLTASVGTVDKIAITEPAKVTYNTATELKYKLYDGTGIEVTGSGSVTYSLVSGTNDAWLDGNKITVFNKDVTVVVQAEYHTGKYGDDYSEITIKSEDFTVRSVENASPVISKFTDAVVTKKDANNDSHFNSNMVVPAGGTGFKFAVKAAKTDGSTVRSGDSQSTGITFETTDPSKLWINTITGEIITIATSGTVGIIVTCGDVKSVYNISIGAKEELAGLTADANSVVLSNAAVPCENKKTITVKAMSNYGNEMTISDLSYEVTKIGGPTETTAFGVNGSASGTKYTITFDASNGSTPGTNYQYKVVIGGKTIILNAIVNDGLTDTKATSYRLVTEKATIDTKVTKDSKVNAYDGATDDGRFTVYAVAYNSRSVAVHVVTLAGITIKNKDGKTVFATDVTGSAATVGTGTGNDEFFIWTAEAGGSEGGKVVIRPCSGAAVAAGSMVAGSYAKLPSGKYTIEGTLHLQTATNLVTSDAVSGASAANDNPTKVIKVALASTSFTVTDSQVIPAVNVKNVQLKANEGNDIRSCFEIKNPHDNAQITGYTVDAVGVNFADGSITNGVITAPTAKGTYSILVKSVTFTETLENGNTVSHKKDLNKVITYINN